MSWNEPFMPCIAMRLILFPLSYEKIPLTRAGFHCMSFHVLMNAHAIPLRLYGKVKIEISVGVGLCSHDADFFVFVAANVKHFSRHANFLMPFLQFRCFRVCRQSAAARLSLYFSLLRKRPVNQ